MFCLAMNISSINNNFYNNTAHFKGHEATRLRAIYVQNSDDTHSDIIFRQLDAIARHHKVEVRKQEEGWATWLQDQTLITPYGRCAVALEELKGLEFPVEKDWFAGKITPGGNIFYVTNKNGEQVLLTGNTTAKRCEMSKKYLQFDKVVSVPQADYHLDLFITPIGDNKILLCDDNLMIEKLREMKSKISECAARDDCEENLKAQMVKAQANLDNLIQKFEESIKNNRCSPLSHVEDVLKQEGFEVIKVPGRLYETIYDGLILVHDLNYANAITYKTPDDEVVLITGKSELDKEIGITAEISDKIGMDFEKIFIDSLQPHIKPENIHFITGSDDGKNHLAYYLKNYKGGLHCMCVEVPEPKVRTCSTPA